MKTHHIQENTTQEARLTLPLKQAVDSKAEKEEIIIMTVRYFAMWLVEMLFLGVIHSLYPDENN